jgi:hypothetical protein
MTRVIVPAARLFDSRAASCEGRSRFPPIRPPGFHFVQPGLQNLLDSLPAKKEAERRQTQVRPTSAPCGAARTLQCAHACRRPTAALARGTFVASGSASGHASGDLAGAHDLMDRQPGRRPHASPRVLPAPEQIRTCPRPVSTSRAGHSAGRMMPEPPGSEW